MPVTLAGRYTSPFLDYLRHLWFQLLTHPLTTTENYSFGNDKCSYGRCWSPVCFQTQNSTSTSELTATRVLELLDCQISTWSSSWFFSWHTFSRPLDPDRTLHLQQLRHAIIRVWDTICHRSSDSVHWRERQTLHRRKASRFIHCRHSPSLATPPPTPVPISHAVGMLEHATSQTFQASLCSFPHFTFLHEILRTFAFWPLGQIFIQTIYLQNNETNGYLWNNPIMFYLRLP